MNKKLLISSLLTLTLISSCGVKDFTSENLINPEDFFTSNNSRYGVYYFQESCPMCVDTLPFINEYLTKVHKNDKSYYLEEIYFIDAATTPLNLFEDKSNRDAFLQDQIGVTQTSDVQQIGYPLLYIVENIDGTNTISNIQIGKKAITDFIKTIW